MWLNVSSLKYANVVHVPYFRFVAIVYHILFRQLPIEIVLLSRLSLGSYYIRNLFFVYSYYQIISRVRCE